MTPTLARAEQPEARTATRRCRCGQEVSTATSRLGVKCLARREARRTDLAARMEQFEADHESFALVEMFLRGAAYGRQHPKVSLGHQVVRNGMRIFSRVVTLSAPAGRCPKAG